MNREGQVNAALWGQAQSWPDSNPSVYGERAGKAYLEALEVGQLGSPEYHDSYMQARLFSTSELGKMIENGTLRTPWDFAK
jgi:hypothetical protein